MSTWIWINIMHSVIAMREEGQVCVGVYNHWFDANSREWFQRGWLCLWP